MGLTVSEASRVHGLYGREYGNGQIGMTLKPYLRAYVQHKHEAERGRARRGLH